MVLEDGVSIMGAGEREGWVYWMNLLGLCGETYLMRMAVVW